VTAGGPRGARQRLNCAGPARQSALAKHRGARADPAAGPQGADELARSAMALMAGSAGAGGAIAPLELRRDHDSILKISLAAHSGLMHARALIEKGNLEEAIGVLDGLDSTLSSLPMPEEGSLGSSIITARGIALFCLERNAEALYELDRAVAIGSDNALTHSYRANALLALDRPEDALASFERVAGLAPDAYHAAIGRAHTLKALGRHAEAVDAYERAIELDGSLASAHSCLGVSLDMTGRYEDALASHDRAVELDPDSPEHHARRATTLLSLVRYEDALDACGRPPPLARRRAGRAGEKKGGRGGAAARRRAAVKAFYGNAPAAGRMGDGENRAGAAA